MVLQVGKKGNELEKAGFEISVSDLLERYAQPEDYECRNVYLIMAPSLVYVLSRT